MNVLLDNIAKENTLARTSVITVCRRNIREVPDCVHDETAKMQSHHMFKLAFTYKEATISSVVMHLTERSFFGGESMVFLMDKMLWCQTVGSVLMCSGVLQNNFYMHPPCAKYMAEEYRKLMLAPSGRNFNGMALWDYLIDRLSNIIEGSRSYGNRAGIDLGFKKCFTFCLTLLQFDYEVSSKNKVEPLVKKCLSYNPERIMIMGGLTNMLNKFLNTKYDLQVLAMDLAALVNRIQLD